MTKPTLKLVRCHRGSHAEAIKRSVSTFADHFMTIKTGPLKGCVRRIIGSNVRSVYRIKARSVLEFVVCIRVRA